MMLKEKEPWMFDVFSERVARALVFRRSRRFKENKANKIVIPPLNEEQTERLLNFVEKKADLVAVVRCKNCKYYNAHRGWCENLERGEYDEHYCSYGDRKE